MNKIIQKYHKIRITSLESAIHLTGKKLSEIRSLYDSKYRECSNNEEVLYLIKEEKNLLKKLSVLESKSKKLNLILRENAN